MSFQKYGIGSGGGSGAGNSGGYGGAHAAYGSAPTAGGCGRGNSAGKPSQTLSSNRIGRYVWVETVRQVSANKTKNKKRRKHSIYFKNRYSVFVSCWPHRTIYPRYVMSFCSLLLLFRSYFGGSGGASGSHEEDRVLRFGRYGAKGGASGGMVVMIARGWIKVIVE